VSVEGDWCVMLCVIMMCVSDVREIGVR